MGISLVRRWWRQQRVALARGSREEVRAWCRIFGGIGAYDPAREKDTHFLQFAHVAPQVAGGFLLGEAQDF